MSVIQTFDESTFTTICDVLAKNDSDLNLILDTYGYPPFWTRAASFETLVHIILEQQVSLASSRGVVLHELSLCIVFQYLARRGILTQSTFAFY